MGVKSSGEISFTTDIVGEYGGTAPHSFSEYKRGGGEVPNITPNNGIPTTNSDISFSGFYGSTDRVAIALSISGTANNYNIWSNKGSDYVAHATDITLTIGSNALVGSSSTATYALETGTGWQGTDTITIVNNGWVIGRGGNGGAGGDGKYNSQSETYAGSNGGDGGNAFRAQHAVTFTNNGNVYGGGGGGGGNGGSYSSADPNVKLSVVSTYGGNGGGGGAGYYTASGGAGGTADGVTISSLFVSNGTDGAVGDTTDHRTSVGPDGGGPGEDGVDGAAGSSGTYNYRAAGGSGGTRGYYQVGSSYINNGSGVNSGNYGGRSS